jgi:peptidoglycan pentaglycine glycine transferase (the first glycine)
MKQIETSDNWDTFVREQQGHPLQLWGWGEVKSLHGWKAYRYLSDDEQWGGQVLLKRLPKPMSAIAYIPRGPVGAIDEKKLDVLSIEVKRRHSLDALLIEPNYESFIPGKGWRQTKHTVLVPDTLILDLAKSEDELMSSMAKKTRQYIRKSSGSIHVKRLHTADELAMCMKVYKETAERANFALHDDEYYFDIFRLLSDDVYVYGAYEEEVLVAFVWLITTPEMAFELYGGITDRGQELKANYGLKWRAITDLKQRGVRRYDMNGLLNDGISTFKRGFASHENHLAGSFERPLSVWYPLWAYGLPLAKRIVRLVRR